ncbi:MAG: glycosyltransferase family 4 protein [Thermoprotei archaeon]
MVSTLNILHVSDNSYPNIGGVERVVHEVAKRQAQSGHHVTVISQHSSFWGMLPTKIYFEGVTYIKLPRPVFPYLAFAYSEKLRPDVIHLNSYLSSSYFSNNNSRRRVVRHVHDVYTNIFQKYFGPNIEHLASALEKRWTRCFDYYIVPSQSTKARLSRLVGNNKKVWVIPNGVDTSVFKPSNGVYIKRRFGLKQNVKLVGFVGRIAFGKGAFDTYLAMKPILKKHENIYLVYIGPADTVGTSGQKSALRKIMAQAALDGVSSKLLYMPPLNDIELALAYSELEVLMLPSVSEGFGLSVLEAAACGTPSIVYDSGSLPELVEDGRTGIIVQQGDIAGLTHALDLILGDSALRDELAANSALKARKYGWENVVSEIAKVYQEIINGC